MKIAVLGSGAMGGLYSSYLSRHNEVTVIDVNAALVEKVNAEGLEVQEPHLQRLPSPRGSFYRGHGAC